MPPEDLTRGVDLFTSAAQRVVDAEQRLDAYGDLVAVASPTTRSVVQAFAEADVAMYDNTSERRADPR